VDFEIISDESNFVTLQEVMNKLHQMVVSILGQRAIDHAQKREAIVNSEKNSAPRPGFMYFSSSFKYVGKLILKKEKSNFFVVPVWDRPAIEYQYPKIYKRDFALLFPFKLIGWGEPIINLNQGKWLDEEKVKAWKLVEILDNWKLKAILKKIDLVCGVYN